MGHEGLRVDPHVKVLDERVAARAKTHGLDGLVYAPHFMRLPEIRERADRFTDDDLFIVPAREVFTGTWRDRKHILAVGLDEPVPDFITLEGAVAEFTRQDAAVLVPHPEFFTVSLDEADIRTYADHIHAVETYNPKHLSVHNRRARAIATAVDRPTFASSYAHLRGTVGEVWTTFPDATPTVDGLLDALIAGTPRRTDHRNAIGHRLRCMIEFSHLGYENSWKKFDRIVLSGREATHPRHEAYDGRFDDVAVY